MNDRMWTFIIEPNYGMDLLRVPVGQDIRPEQKKKLIYYFVAINYGFCRRISWCDMAGGYFSPFPSLRVYLYH